MEKTIPEKKRSHCCALEEVGSASDAFRVEFDTILAPLGCLFDENTDPDLSSLLPHDSRTIDFLAAYQGDM